MSMNRTWTLEGNQLGGSLPPSLGNLSNLKELLLSANNFTGTVPELFVNLKNLTDFTDMEGNKNILLGPRCYFPKSIRNNTCQPTMWRIKFQLEDDTLIGN